MVRFFDFFLINIPAVCEKLMYGKVEVEIRKICIYEYDFLIKDSSAFKIAINFADRAAEKIKTITCIITGICKLEQRRTI